MEGVIDNHTYVFWSQKIHMLEYAFSVILVITCKQLAEMCGLRTRQSADADPRDFFCGSRFVRKFQICGRGLTRILFCDECIFPSKG